MRVPSHIQKNTIYRLSIKLRSFTALCILHSLGKGNHVESSSWAQRAKALNQLIPTENRKQDEDICMCTYGVPIVEQGHDRRNQTLDSL